MKKLLSLSALILVVIALTACGEVGTPEKVSSSSTAAGSKAPASDKASEAPAKPTVFKKGEIVKMGDYQLTVTGVSKYAGSEFEKPKKGNEYVIVEVKIENKGTEKIMYNAFDFKLANSKGQIQDSTFIMKDDDTRLDSAELAPNGTVEGTIAFEAPKGDKALQLQYQPSFWSEDAIKVDLQ